MAGRPKAIIDWDRVIKYLQAHCEGAAIARLMGLHPNTLYQAVEKKYNCNFSEFSQQKKGESVALMEDSIFRDAIKKGGPDRMFWLKNKAGWKDKQEFDHTTGGEKINITFSEKKNEP
jgi:hypothetical protein